MATLEIPLPSETPFFTLRTVIAEREFTFRFAYNQRSEFWSFDISDEEGEKLYSGVRLVIGYPLNLLWTDERAPKGLLVAFDLTGSGREATLADLGRRVRLYFVEASGAAGASELETGAVGVGELDFGEGL